MRRSTVLTMPPHLEFPLLTVTNTLAYYSCKKFYTTGLRVCLVRSLQLVESLPSIEGQLHGLCRKTSQGCNLLPKLVVLSPPP